MTTTEHAPAEQAPTPPLWTINRTPAGTLIITIGDDVLEVPWAQGGDLAESLREEYFTHAPELQRVIGYASDNGQLRALDVEQAAAALAEGWDVEHGLRCPHTDCGYIAWSGYDSEIHVVDADERWNGFGYLKEPDGERLTGDYDSETNYASIGFRCVSCINPVTLPDDIEVP